MEQTENDRPDLPEFDKDEPLAVTPTYHWSEIQSPRLKDPTIDILSQPVIVTQKVHETNDAANGRLPRSAIVIYDTGYLQYKLLEFIAPLLCDWKDKSLDGFVENPDTEYDESVIPLEHLTSELAQIFLKTTTSSIKYHDEAIETCNNIGVELPFTSKFLLRSFKLAKLKASKTSTEF